MSNYRTLALAALLALAAAFPLAAGERLVLDTPERGEIAWGRKNAASFVVSVPQDAVALTIDVTDAPVQLEIYARHGKPMTDYESEAEHWTDADRLRDSLRISRSHSPALESGIYYVDVVYGMGTPPLAGKRLLKTIPFTIRASLIRPRIDAAITPDARIAGKTTPEDGHFRTFTVDVPPGAEALRIDLDEVAGDLDIALRHERQIVAPTDADAYAATAIGRETLLLDRNSTPPLAAGRWFINVFDPMQQGTVPFAAYVRFAREPPPSLLAIPPLPQPASDLDRAVQATVELFGQDLSGSGTLLSPDGLILTNYHVIEAFADGVTRDGELVIGITLDDRKPSTELFRGRVIAADKKLDLSLVEITSGLYGQPLPKPYRFPHLELGDPRRLHLGSPIAILGFPTIGGTGSRASVTYSRGVVSGFELDDIGVLIKTDADLSPGNSGGAAIDEGNRLIGVPTAVVSEVYGNEQIGYIYPIDILPREWLEIIRRRAAE